MKTFSLEVSKRFKEKGVALDEYSNGDFVWFKFCNRPEEWRLSQVTIHDSRHKCGSECMCECETCYPYGNEDGIKAITLQDLPYLLEELGKVKGWDCDCCDGECEHDDCCGKVDDNCAICCPCHWDDFVTHHFGKVCSLYAQHRELGEGSECEKYLLDLMK